MNPNNKYRVTLHCDDVSRYELIENLCREYSGEFEYIDKSWNKCDKAVCDAISCEFLSEADGIRFEKESWKKLSWIKK